MGNMENTAYTPLFTVHSRTDNTYIILWLIGLVVICTLIYIVFYTDIFGTQKSFLFVENNKTNGKEL